MIAVMFRSQDGQIETIGQDEIDDTIGESAQTKPQTADTVGKSSALPPSQSIPPRLASCGFEPQGYMLIYQPSHNDIMHRLGMVEDKVQLMEGCVKPWMEISQIIEPTSIGLVGFP